MLNPKGSVLVSIALMLLAGSCLLFLNGCIEAAAIGSAAAGGAGYLAYREISVLGPNILYYAAKEGTIIGLQKLPVAIGPTVAKDAAMACQDAINYLNTGTLPTADIVNQIITGKFSNIDPTVLAEIQKVAAYLGQYVPSASVILTGTEISYLVKFLQGIQDGCNDYLGNNNVKVKIKYTKNEHLDKATLKQRSPSFKPWFQGFM